MAVGASGVHAGVLGWWRFEGGPAGALVFNTPTRSSADSSGNGHHADSFALANSASFSDAVPEPLGPWTRTNNLPNDAGTVRLRNRLGAVLLEVNYSDEPPWPAAADGGGHSLVLARPIRVRPVSGSSMPQVRAARRTFTNS